MACVFTIWEGAHETHDLLEQAHLALGEEFLKAGRPAEALAQFNRAVEYPANLATGKLENAPKPTFIICAATPSWRLEENRSHGSVEAGCPGP
jgi:hypothetical protein